MTQQELAAAVREMADVIENMPPCEVHHEWFVHALIWPDTADKFRAIARAMSPF